MNILSREILGSAWVPKYRGRIALRTSQRLQSHTDASESIRVCLNEILRDKDLDSLRNARVLNVQKVLGPIKEDTPSLDILGLLRENDVRDVLSLYEDANEPDDNFHTSTLGNNLEPRFWKGDLLSLPAYMGPFQVVLLNADSIDEKSGGLRDLLVPCSLMMKPGGSICIWGSNEIKLERENLENIIRDLCLELVEISQYTIRLRVPENFKLKNNADVKYMEGEIVTGYGRGSKKLGVPTANLRPADVEKQIEGLPPGVYFGWAQLIPAENTTYSEEDRSVFKMVMNIGKRPTFVKDNSPDISVEVHVMHSYKDDFYGQKMRVAVLGYLRPEMKFENINSLLSRIQTDIGISSSQLDGDPWAAYADDPFFN